MFIKLSLESKSKKNLPSHFVYDIFFVSHLIHQALKRWKE